MKLAGMEPMICLWIPPFGFDRTRNGIMAGWRQVIELAMTDEEIGRLAVIARSRSEPASRVERAQMMLAYREKPSFFAVGQDLGQHHQTVQRCVERALAYGPLTALDDRPRPGRRMPPFHPGPVRIRRALARLLGLGPAREPSISARYFILHAW